MRRRRFCRDEARALLEAGWTRTAVAKKFGVHVTAISEALLDPDVRAARRRANYHKHRDKRLASAREYRARKAASR